jgi:hypothetical protein
VVRRSAAGIAILAVFLPVVAFSVLTFLSGTTVGFLRYHIVVVPLAACLVAWLLAGRPVAARRRRLRAASGAGVAIASLAALAIALPTSLQAMRDPNLGREESDQLRPLLSSTGGATRGSFVVTTNAIAGSVAETVDGLRPGRGGVLVDVALGNAIVLQSRDPAQFVITTDRDFAPALADPAAFGVRYLLVSTPAGLGQIDAVNRTYPGLYWTGNGIAELVRQFGDGTGAAWRLYDLGVSAEGG